MFATNTGDVCLGRHKDLVSKYHHTGACWISLTTANTAAGNDSGTVILQVGSTYMRLRTMTCGYCPDC